MIWSPAALLAMYIAAMHSALSEPHRGCLDSASRRGHSGLPAGIGLALLVAIATPCIFAQQAMPGGHNMSDMQPVLPPDQLPAPIRMTGIGNAHIAVTANPEAQVWFHQGLNLMHDFWDYESTKAFEQSVRVDPNCAMCWWGLAQAEGFRHSPRQVYGKAGAREGGPARRPCHRAGEALYRGGKGRRIRQRRTQNTARTSNRLRFCASW